MNGDQMPRRLSAALRAQASGPGPGSSLGSAHHPRSAPVRAKPRMPASALLGLALLLGAVAGGLAGVVSAW
ncbi:MAG: hypothetical protein M3186_05945 [Actinomycetota bacterium]|nr:hypothetical protein [Actinomycetota bacterium]